MRQRGAGEKELEQLATGALDADNDLLLMQVSYGDEQELYEAEVFLRNHVSDPYAPRLMELRKVGLSQFAYLPLVQGQTVMVRATARNQTVGVLWAQQGEGVTHILRLAAAHIWRHPYSDVVVSMWTVLWKTIMRRCSFMRFSFLNEETSLMRKGIFVGDEKREGLYHKAAADFCGEHTAFQGRAEVWEDPIEMSTVALCEGHGLTAAHLTLSRDEMPRSEMRQRTELSSSMKTAPKSSPSTPADEASTDEGSQQQSLMPDSDEDIFDKLDDIAKIDGEGEKGDEDDLHREMTLRALQEDIAQSKCDSGDTPDSVEKRMGGGLDAAGAMALEMERERAEHMDQLLAMHDDRDGVAEHLMTEVAPEDRVAGGDGDRVAGGLGGDRTRAEMSVVMEANPDTLRLISEAVARHVAPKREEKKKETMPPKKRDPWRQNKWDKKGEAGSDEWQAAMERNMGYGEKGEAVQRAKSEAAFQKLSLAKAEHDRQKMAGAAMREMTRQGVGKDSGAGVGAPADDVLPQRPAKQVGNVSVNQDDTLLRTADGALLVNADGTLLQGKDEARGRSHGPEMSEATSRRFASRPSLSPDLRGASELEKTGSMIPGHWHHGSRRSSSSPQPSPSGDVHVRPAWTSARQLPTAAGRAELPRGTDPTVSTSIQAVRTDSGRRCLWAQTAAR